MKIYLLTISLFFFFIQCTENEKERNINVSLNEAQTKSLAKDLRLLGVDSTLKNNDSLIRITDKIIKKYPNNKGDVDEKVAHFFYRKGNLYLTKFYFEKSAQEFLKDSSELRYAEQLTNIGVLNELIGDYPEAITNYYKALAIFNRKGEELKSSFVYNNLGVVYQKLKDRRKAIELYNQSLAIVQRIGREDLTASKYNNLASVYEEFDNNIDSALFYYNSAYLIVEKDTQNIYIATIGANLANIYIQKGELKKADSILNKVLKLNTWKKIETGIISIYKFKSKLFLKKENYLEAEKFAEKSIDKAIQQKFKGAELESRKILISCLQKQKNTKRLFLN